MNVDVRWARYHGPQDQDEAERIIKHDLYKCGDTIIVWVNEGDILRHTNMDPLPKDLAAENKRLKAGIEDLRRVWFAGSSLDKDAISQQCLSLFRLAGVR